jgi:hypothetical protein
MPGILENKRRRSRRFVAPTGKELQPQKGENKDFSKSELNNLWIKRKTAGYPWVVIYPRTLDKLWARPIPRQVTNNVGSLGGGSFVRLLRRKYILTQ